MKTDTYSKKLMDTVHVLLEIATAHAREASILADNKYLDAVRLTHMRFVTIALQAVSEAINDDSTDRTEPS